MPIPLLPNATSLIGQCLGASNLLEGNTRVIRVLEPIEPPITSGLELRRETIALRARRDTAVLLAPAIGRSTELRCARVEEAYAATGDSKVEVVVSKIATCVCGLNDHLLA